MSNQRYYQQQQPQSPGDKSPGAGMELLFQVFCIYESLHKFSSFYNPVLDKSSLIISPDFHTVYVPHF